MKQTEALCKSVKDSAAVYGRAFIYYLAFVGYPAFIILSVTDVHLFMDADLIEPVLGMKFRTSYFFVIVPWIFVLLHFNLLMHMAVLSRKLTDYREYVGDDSQALGTLPDVHLIQSAYEKHDWFLRGMIKCVFIYGVLIWLPIVILCSILREFLAFQSGLISSFQCLAILIDIGLVIYFHSDMKEIYTPLKSKPISKLNNRVCASMSVFLAIAAFFALDFVFYVGKSSDYKLATYIQLVTQLDVSNKRLYLESDKVELSPHKLLHVSSNNQYLINSDTCKKDRTLEVDLKDRSYKGANLQGAILCNLNLSNADLQGANLGGAELQGAVLSYADLEGATLSYADLEGATLFRATLQGADLSYAQLQSVVLISADLKGADLRVAGLQGADLSYAQLQSVVLIGADLKGADLRVAGLQGANLSDAVLQSANMFSAELQGANLGDAQLQGADLRHADLQGDALLIEAELQGANLGYAQLQGADLRYTDLQGANLGGADLRGAILIRADLQGANLGGADLQGANLIGADLQGANLRDAGLQGAILSDAQLQGADLVYANLQGAILEEADLQGANLRYAELQGAFLYGAGLQGAVLISTQLQGAVLISTQLQGAVLISTQLQGVFSNQASIQDDDLRTLESASSEGVFTFFQTLITLRINQTSDLSGISNVVITNITAYIQTITAEMGEFVDNDRVSDFIKRMEESEANPFANISQDNKGIYTEEEANQWIKEYKDAVCKIPKDIYEERYGEKLDCP